MRKLYTSVLFLFLLLFVQQYLYAQRGGVTIGADKDPHPSAILELQATNKGFLPPRMTAAQRDAIISPAEGLIVYVTDASSLYLFDGKQWKAVTANNSLSHTTASTMSTANTMATGTASVAAPDAFAPFGTTNFDTSLGKLVVSDGNVWRDPNTGCLPSYLKKIVVTRPGSNASAFDASGGNLNLFGPNQARNLYDFGSGKDLGILIEKNDSNLLFQSEALTDINLYNGTRWNSSNVTAISAGTLAGRNRFLFRKTDANLYSGYRKIGMKLSYNVAYFASVIVQRKNATSFLLVIHSDGAGTDSGITLDLLTGDVVIAYSTAGPISNVKAVPLKSIGGAWLLTFNFTPNSQGAANTTFQFRMLPNSTVIGDDLYVAAPFLTPNPNSYNTYIPGGQGSSLRGQEAVKVDLGLQSSGSVLVKALNNDQKTSVSRAISWKSFNGVGLDSTGGGFTSGYAIAENGALIEIGGMYNKANITAGTSAYYIDPTAPTGGDGSQANPFNSFQQLPALTGNLNGLQILLKRGTKIREQLSIFGCSNFIVDSYSDGVLPIIDGADTVKTTWALDSTNNLWYLPTQTVQQTYFVNGVRYIGVALKNQMSLNTGTSWYDTTNQRTYINTGGINPNTQFVEYTNRAYGLQVNSSSSFVVRNLQFQRARNCGFSGYQLGDSCVVERCIAKFNGAFESPTNLAGDGFALYGTSGNAKGNNNVIRQCISLSNVNCAYEVAFHDKLTIEDNYGSLNGQGIEVWGFVTNSVIQRNKLVNTVPLGVSWGHGNGVWIPSGAIQPSITGGQNNIKIISNVFATTWRETLDIQAGKHEIVNNLMFDPSRFIKNFAATFARIGRLYANDSVAVVMKNNLFYQTDFNPILMAAFIIDNTVSSAKLDNNYYYSATSSAKGEYTPFVYLGTRYGLFADYQKGTQQDSNGASQINPQFVKVAGINVPNLFVTFSDSTTQTSLTLTNETQTDFHLQTASPCAGTGNANVSGTVGIDFIPYSNPRSVGPYAAFAGNPISLGDPWIGGLNFRGGTLVDVQASKGTLPGTSAVVQLSQCK